MKARLCVVVCLAWGLLNCSSGDPSSGPGPETSPPIEPSAASTDAGSGGVAGGIELRAWPELTVASIGEKLSVETVQEIIGANYPVTAEKSDYGPDWKYSWASPDKTERGSVIISVTLDGQTESNMQIQAKVRLGMVEQGTGEEIDLKDFGVIGVYRTAWCRVVTQTTSTG